MWIIKYSFYYLFVYGILGVIFGGVFYMKRTLEEEYELIRILDIDELIPIINNFNYEVQEYFYRYCSKATDLVNKIIIRHV